jgi:iron complex outermembrane recepter protein
MQRLTIKSMILANKRTILSLCLGLPLGFFWQSANAAPLAIPKIAATAQGTDNTLIRAKALAGQWSSRASELQPRPALWDWTNPITLSQATSTPTQDSPKNVLPSDSAPNNATILDEVTVTATRRPTRERDTTVITYVVKREEFGLQGATTVTDALQLIPGYQGAPSLGGVRNSGLNFLRGFDDQRFQLLRDGITLQRASNGRSDISRIDIEDLQRIEVVTGGATLRYGSGSIGGVINLITETPSGLPKLTLKYGVGSYGFSKYVAKFGGGDNTFSYSFVYSGLVAFNDYPFSLTVPNSALFYGPADTTSSGVSLYGLLRPEVGPPVTVKGKADTAFTASDTYSAKIVIKPDVFNRITLRVGQQNSTNEGNGPGNYYFGICKGGLTTSSRFLPRDNQGREQECTTQRFLPNTPTTVFASRYAYNSSFDGSILFPTGQAYQGAESIVGNVDFNRRSSQGQTEAALFWDYDFTPTSSINSYVGYTRVLQQTTQPLPYLYNTNVLGSGRAGQIGQFTPPQPAQPFIDSTRLEIQSALNTKLSPGQSFSFGVNYVEERSYQQQNSGTSFFDRAIARTSVFVINDVSFDQNLKANFGLRYTYSTQFGQVLTPALGVRYSPVNFISFRANGSYVFNSPSLSLLFVAGPPFLENPSLRPESGVTYDVGFDINASQDLTFRFTYFNTYLDGAIATVASANSNANSNTAFPQLFQAQNLNTRIASGTEFTADWRLSEQFRLRLAWTNTDARFVGSIDVASQSTYPFFYQYQDPAIPFNNVVGALTYSNKGFIVTLLSHFDSGKRIASIANSTGKAQGSPEYLPSYITLDLNLEIPLTPNFTLTGNIYNLTDTNYEYISGLPAPGVTFRVGGKLEFEPTSSSK